MSAPTLFGTDGIRGQFGRSPLDRPTLCRLARALASWALEGELERNASRQAAPPRGRFVLGGDTRDSTPIILGWLTGALREAGCGLLFLGVIPTPAVALLARKLGASAGIVVSASHNPHPDNGIKLIGRDGFKLDQETEKALEARLASQSDAPAPRFELEIDHQSIELYFDELRGSLGSSRPLEGLRIALDTGNGAAAPHAQSLFEGLGAECQVICDQPDGTNINRGCGSTAPQVVAELVRQGAHDLGFAFDGDADRVIPVDDRGEIRDGDAVLYLWARELAMRDQLPKRKVVATSMSNLGLERALAGHGIEVVRCDVGDRQVVDTLRQQGLTLGGEQSGHIVNLELGTTGDGLLTALRVAAIVARAGRPLSELLEEFRLFPQLLHNVPVRQKPPLESVPGLEQKVSEVEERLADQGRLVLRYSGTESLARIMLEGPELAVLQNMAEELGAVISQHLAPG